MLEENADGPAFEAELPLLDMEEGGQSLVLEENTDGPLFEAELPLGDMEEGGPLPVIDGDSATADSTYNSSGSGTSCHQARILTFPFDRGTLSPKSARREGVLGVTCLLYTSPSPRDLSTSRMPSSA